MQKNNNISSLFDQAGNLSPDTMERYLKGELMPEELSAVEKHLAESPFEREALEGLTRFRSVQLARDLEELHGRINEAAAGSEKPKPVRNISRYYWVAAASAIGLLAVTAIIVLMFRTAPQGPEFARAESDAWSPEGLSPEDPTLLYDTSLMKPQQKKGPTASAPAPDREPDDKTPKEETGAIHSPPPLTQQIAVVEDDVEIEPELDLRLEQHPDPSVIGAVLPESKATASDRGVESNAAYTIKQEDIVMMKEEEAANSEADVFFVVEAMPEFPGGEKALEKYLGENLQYPESAKENGIQGRVFVTFVVEKDGSISDIRVLRGIGGGCDEEAIRVIREMPEWKPGTQRGMPVRVQFNLPISFHLN